MVSKISSPVVKTSHPGHSIVDTHPLVTNWSATFLGGHLQWSMESFTSKDIGLLWSRAGHLPSQLTKGVVYLQDTTSTNIGLCSLTGQPP